MVVERLIETVFQSISQRLPKTGSRKSDTTSVGKSKQTASTASTEDRC